MQKQDFTVTVEVEQTPKEAFDAITNVRGWWSGEIEGAAYKSGDAFTYRFKDIHYSKQQLTEIIPEKKIVWLVTDASLNFVEDKREWIGTKIIFDLAEKDGKTQIRFTHEGLTPQIECFDACSNAWTGYIADSLRKYIPEFSRKDRDFTATILVGETPQQAYDAINNVRGWWSQNIQGKTDTVGSEWTYSAQDLHRCKIRVEELVPGRKVVWTVLENYFKFTADQTEWINTRIVFDIAPKDGRTEVRFTHYGLVPAHECFEVCNKAWSFYIYDSLKSLIATGKGDPNPKE